MQYMMSIFLTLDMMAVMDSNRIYHLPPIVGDSNYPLMCNMSFGHDCFMIHKEPIKYHFPISNYYRQVYDVEQQKYIYINDGCLNFLQCMPEWHNNTDEDLGWVVIRSFVSAILLSRYQFIGIEDVRKSLFLYKSLFV